MLVVYDAETPPAVARAQQTAMPVDGCPCRKPKTAD
jgi:hypothetical protein